MWINEELIDFENDYAFIYLITNLSNGKKYIGSKILFNTRKVKISKREKIKTKSRKTFKYVVKESNWETYTGSNKDLNTDISNGDIIKKKILKMVQTKKQKTYWETYYQMVNHVLLDDMFYNSNILGRFYGNDLKK